MMRLHRARHEVAEGSDADAALRPAETSATAPAKEPAPAELWAQSSERIKHRDIEASVKPAAPKAVPAIHPAWAKSNGKLQALRKGNHAKTV